MGAPPFVQQLHRAAAQRGKLDPLYQDLSDRLTMVLQRLYPVWALVGPALSDPGHIEIHSRSIYLESDELLAPRAQLERGELERRAVLCCLGVALHETFHAKHTKRWVAEHDAQLATSDPQLATDRRLLEEPRMEAHGVRDHPPTSVRGRFIARALAAAVTDALIPRALAADARTRDAAARASVYLQARTHYAIIDPSALTRLTKAWTETLGEADLRALDDLYARVIWIPDGDIPALTAAAREYREIVGEPDPAPTDGETDSEPDDALADALERTRAAQLEQLNEQPNLQQLLDTITRSDPGPPGRGGTGTGAPSGRMPERGVDRPPAPDEILQARRYATRLRQALVHGTRRIDKRTPGGRFDGRAYTRGQAQRATGRPVSTHPWQITRQLRAPIQTPHVALIIDTSGSMSTYEYALGPIAWILTDGLRQIDGRCAIALFGNGASLLTDGRHPLPLVPGIRTGDRFDRSSQALVRDAEQRARRASGLREQNSLQSRDELRRFAAQTTLADDTLEQVTAAAERGIQRNQAPTTCPTRPSGTVA